MSDFGYQDLKEFITTNVKESYCILPVRYGGIEMIAMKKPGTKKRWWHTSCLGRFKSPEGMKELPIGDLFEASAPIETFTGSSYYNPTCSQKELIDSLLYDTTWGLWYEGCNLQKNQAGRGGTTEFIFLKKNVDNSYSLTYLDNVAYYIDFSTSVVARNLILRIYAYAGSHNLNLHHLVSLRVGRISTPGKKRGE